MIAKSLALSLLLIGAATATMPTVASTCPVIICWVPPDECTAPEGSSCEFKCGSRDAGEVPAYLRVSAEGMGTVEAKAQCGSPPAVLYEFGCKSEAGDPVNNKCSDTSPLPRGVAYGVCHAIQGTATCASLKIVPGGAHVVLRAGAEEAVQ